MEKENRLLAILSYIYSNESPKTTKEISRSLHIPLSTVYRTMRILKDWGFITDAHETDGVVSGPTSYSASLQFQRYSTMSNIFSPFLKLLVSETKETAAIIVPTPHHTLCVALEESPSLLKCSFSLGSKQSLIKGASAKTILAFQDKKTTQLLLKQYALDKNLSFQEEISHIKTNGYGISIGEIDADVWGVSFPIFKKGELFAVLTTMAPYYRAQMHAHQLISATQKQATHINDFLSNSY